jgi:hypothetical protein
MRSLYSYSSMPLKIQHLVVLLMLAVGLLGVQGCGQGGEWFPKSRTAVRKQTLWDKGKEGPSALDEPRDRSAGGWCNRREDDR